MLVDQGSRLPCSAFAPSEIENSLYTDERDKRAVIDRAYNLSHDGGFDISKEPKTVFHAL
jgi:hypothetical protein